MALKPLGWIRCWRRRREGGGIWGGLGGGGAPPLVVWHSKRFLSARHAVEAGVQGVLMGGGGGRKVRRGPTTALPPRAP